MTEYNPKTGEWEPEPESGKGVPMAVSSERAEREKWYRSLTKEELEKMAEMEAEMKREGYYY